MDRKSDLDAWLRFIVGGVTLAVIVGVVLYSLVFVMQPLDALAPADAEFFKLITPLATFIAGALGGVMASGSGKSKCKEKEDA
jgi:fumarate reductase subunit D